MYVNEKTDCSKLIIDSACTTIKGEYKINA